MAYFMSPVQQNSLNKNDDNPMPKLIESTYQDHFKPPKVRIKITLKEEAEATHPPDYLPQSAQDRILPYKFSDFFKNCISISVGEKLELKFTDDTPEWKKFGRKEAADNWIKKSSKQQKNSYNTKRRENEY